MADIRCKDCNELSDINAIKCESCKASLYDASEVDACERDYRFIEEAELKGEIYKWEVVEDENRAFEEISAEKPVCSIKVEKEAITDTVFEENGRVPNGTVKSNKEVLRTEADKSDNSLNTDHHIENTIPIAAYPCDKCSKSFKRKASLKAHVDRVHTPDSFGKCLDSKAKQSRSMHMPSPSCSAPYDSDYEPPQEDSQCNASGTQLRSLNKEKRKHEQISGEPNSESNNSRKKCKIKTSSSQTLLDLKQNIPTLKRHMVYKCTACEKISNNYKDHINHVVIHEAPVESLTETTSLEKLKKAPSGFLNCDQCEEVFMTERAYNTHLKIHMAESVVQCEICEGVLVNHSSLRKHMIKMHQTELTKERDKHYECNICCERFPAEILLLDHRKIHLDVIKKIEEMTFIDRGGGKPIYVCKVCTRTSKNKFRHEEHLRIHTKEKPFKCEECGERIATTNAMAHHRRLHENDRPFKCNICDSAYRHKKSLKKHLILHTGKRPFKCHYCEKTFALNYMRASHERNCHIGNAKTKQKARRIGKTIKADVPTNETAAEGAIETRSADS